MVYLMMWLLTVAPIYVDACQLSNQLEAGICSKLGLKSLKGFMHDLDVTDLRFGLSIFVVYSNVTCAQVWNKYCSHLECVQGSCHFRCWRALSTVLG